MENVGSGQIVQEYGSLRGWDYTTQVQVQRFLIDHRYVIPQYAQILTDRAAGLAGSLMWLLLIPILAAFLLKDNAHFAGTFLGLIKGNQQRGFLRSLLNDLDAMGRGLKLHPLAVIFGVLVGGEIAGVVGLFLSVPIIASLRIIWKAWRLQPAENEGNQPRITRTTGMRKTTVTSA
jgi:predicted PurR-regulated permease PerM